MSKKQQPAALDVFACPLHGIRLIEASAGTGKTWNICGLYLRLLLEKDLQVQQILVVTFTNAAMAELRERVRDRIAEVLARLEGRGPAGTDPFITRLLETQRAAGRTDQEMVKCLTRALRGFDEAAIFTIHGFCKRALDDAPFAAGLPLMQELTQNDGDLRHQAVNDFWRRQVAGGHLQPELSAWLLQCKDSPERMAKLLARHVGKPLSAVLWPEGTQAPVAITGTAGLATAHAAAHALWRADRANIVRCVAEAMPRLNGNRYKEKTVATAAQQWDAVLASADPTHCPPTGDKLELFTTGCLKPKGKCAPCESHAFFEIAEALLEAWAGLQEQLERARMHLLRQLVEQVPAQLRKLKRERQLVAFDDMLFNLHERLEGGNGKELAATLRSRFPAALIDEFQDTDPLQFSIFEHVYGGGTPAALFLVGDPKQAIYSFRNADLHIYLHAREKAQAEYTLAQNQRSTPQLLKGLNALFAKNPRAFMLQGLDYRAVSAGEKPRKPLVDTTEPRAALQLWSLPVQGDGEPMKKDAARRTAALACAGEIARLLAAGQAGKITHDQRNLAARDMAVLVRTHAEGSLMRETLAALGVGSVELRQTSVFKSADAQELETILRAISEPGRETLLRAALATELLGLNAQQIETLAGDEAAMLERIGRFSDYRTAWAQRGIAPMLRELVAREGINPRMLLRADGERRLTNLRHLSECLHEAAQEHPGPEALLRWLQSQRREDLGDDATQVRLESDRNLVQIVTIFKAKGLEYPIVFCPFLWDGHPGGGGGTLMGCEYHDDDGNPVIDYRDLSKDKTIVPRIRQEKDAERLRLIYVALTRAVHRCYLVVGSYRVGKSSSECTSNPLNWLVAGRGIAPADWRGSKMGTTQIADAWKLLSSKNDPVIALQPLPATRPVQVQIPRPAPDDLAALQPPARIPPGWWIGSYSGLAHGARHEAAAADHDLRAQRPASGPAPATLGEDDILRFPRGARAGECLHAVFERIDFTDSAGWPQAIAEALRAHPPGATASAQESLPAMAHRMLDDVLNTPLPGGLMLCQVPRHRRLVELEFSLSAPALDTVQLASTLTRHGYLVPDLGRQFLRGYLRGFVDLVFEHQERFYILDWKSNHLGHGADDYAPAAVGQAMDAQGYRLQYLLYTVAIHRWLRQRLAGYRYEQHFGGVHYLFVRGVRPSWKTAGGKPCGVFHDRPSLELVQELDALLSSGARRAA